MTDSSVTALSIVSHVPIPRASSPSLRRVCTTVWKASTRISIKLLISAASGATGSTATKSDT
jgi:hypothetical protein